MRWLVALLILAGPAAADIVVATRTIRSLALIGPEDVRVVAGEVPGAAVAADEVVGLEARAIVYAGRPVLMQQLGPPAVVERNQIVSLIFRRGAMTITAEGRALARAGIGDEVRVMNLASKKTVTGRVARDGSINVGNP
jgi:flagella basal body P-ring formation protein FlgA